MDPRYPIGNFDYKAVISEEQLKTAIEEIRSLPKRIQK